MQTETLIYIQELSTKVAAYCGGHPKTLDDIQHCLEQLHGEIREVDTLDITVDGFVAKTEDDGFVIKLPKLMNEQDKLLYTATGIGHAFLHLNYHPTERKVNWLFMEPEFFYKLDSAASAQAFEFAHLFLQDGKNKYKLPDRKES